MDVFARLDAAIGARLFTVTVHDPEAGLVRRAYSSDPVAYPLSGTKPLDLDDAWSRQVIGQRQVFVANAPDGYRDLFPDHALIAALGCGAVVNVPVVREDGAVVATVNVLDAEGHFPAGRVVEITALIAGEQAALLAAVAEAAAVRSQT